MLHKFNFKVTPDFFRYKTHFLGIGEYKFLGNIIAGCLVQI